MSCEIACVWNPGMSSAALLIQRWFRHELFKRRVRLFLGKCMQLNRHIRLIQRCWRRQLKLNNTIASKCLLGWKVRRLMTSAAFRQKKVRLKDIDDEITQSQDPSWTALMLKEMYKAKASCSIWLRMALARRDWYSYGNRVNKSSKVGSLVGFRE